MCLNDVLKTPQRLFGRGDYRSRAANGTDHAAHPQASWAAEMHDSFPPFVSYHVGNVAVSLNWWR